MSLGKIIATSILALTISTTAKSQNISTVLLPNSSEVTNGIPKPKSPPSSTLSVRIQAETFFGYTPPFSIGIVEVRPKSLYASLLFDHYQLLFEQINDSIFVEHLYNNSVRKSLERYEVFTMVKRKNSLVLIGYTAILGQERKDKQALVNKEYSSEFTPTIFAVNKYLNNTLEQKVNLVVFGLPYNFRTHQTINKDLLTTYADMSTVPKDENDRLLLERYVSVSSKKENKKLIPQKFEGQFTVVNSGFLDGTYKASGIVIDKE